MRKTASAFLLLGATAAITIAGYVFYRNQAMNRLFAEASGYPSFLRSSNESTHAVSKLAAYRGQRATEMLVEIALGHGPLVFGEAQEEAIKALSKRGDPEVANALVKLLQPHEGLDTRKAVAGALQDLPCKGECIRSLLHYLERVWRGEPNYEDRAVRPRGYEDIIKSLRDDQRMLYANLYAVLRREKLETLTNLAQVYGLGSDSPSTFALDLSSRLELHESCLLLLKSARAIQKLPPNFFDAPREELQSAIVSLNCK
jgi:hypothetical protein